MSLSQPLARIVAGVTAVSAVFAFSNVVVADNIQDSIASNGSVSLVAGSGVGGTATVRVVGNNSDGPTTDPGCNWDDGEPALVLDIVTPAGVTANPDPLSITECGVDHTITFTASASAVSGTATATISSTPTGGGGYNNQIDIPISVTRPVPTNTAPSVTIQGVIDGAGYEIGAEPSPTCAVTDAQDVAPTATPAITGTLSHGLGALTVTCDYTDGGGLAAPTATKTYTIVDTGDPTISHTAEPAANANGWRNQDVTVSFTCADVGGSGIQSCLANGEGDHDVVIGEGAGQSVSGTATDWAGNTATDTASGINVDKTDPTVHLVDAPPATVYFGANQLAPTCTASDIGGSGIDGTCDVTGGGTSLGTHTWTATATDLAGNITRVTSSYEVLAWNLTGFYQPVDMNGVFNTVKGGSTVPLKFEVFAGSELTTTAAIGATFTVRKVVCSSGAVTDDVEMVTTGATSLRYDATAGQFIQNWKTPTGAGVCYAVTVTTADGSFLTALFKTK